MTAGMVRVDVSDEMPLTTEPVRLLTPVVDCPDEDYADPFCVCPDGMPCCCVAESVDPIENIYD